MRHLPSMLRRLSCVVLFTGFVGCTDNSESGSVPAVPPLLAGMYANLEQSLRDSMEKQEPTESMIEVAAFSQILVLNGKIEEAEREIEKLRKSEKTVVALKEAEDFLRDARKAPDFQALNLLYVSANKRTVTLLGEQIQQKFKGVAAELERDVSELKEKRSAPPRPEVNSQSAPHFAEPVDSALGAKLNRARFVPHYVDGKPVGFRIRAIRDKYLLARGVKSGDIVFSIAGTPLVSESSIPETARLKGLWDEGEVRIDMERDGVRKESVLSPLTYLPEYDVPTELHLTTLSTSRGSLGGTSGFSAVADTARAVPYFKDGVTVGVRLFAIKNDSPLLKLQLVNGDRVEKLAGNAVANPEKFFTDLATLIKNGAPFSIEFTRDDAPFKIEVK